MNQWKRGNVFFSVIMEGDPNPKERLVPLTSKKLKTYIGVDDLTEASKVLSPLGFEASTSSPERIIFKVPSFRMDVEIEEDLIEEVARLKGYDELPARLPAKNPDSATIGTEPALKKDQGDADGSRLHRLFKLQFHIAKICKGPTASPLR